MKSLDERTDRVVETFIIKKINNQKNMIVIALNKRRKRECPDISSSIIKNR